MKDKASKDKVMFEKLRYAVLSCVCVCVLVQKQGGALTEQQQLCLGPELLAGLQLAAAARTEQPLLAGGCWSPCDQSSHSLFGQRTRDARVTRGRDEGGVRGSGGPPHSSSSSSSLLHRDKWHSSRHG